MYECGLCVNQVLAENECHTQIVSLKKFNKTIICKDVGMVLRIAGDITAYRVLLQPKEQKKLIERAEGEKL